MGLEEEAQRLAEERRRRTAAASSPNRQLAHQAEWVRDLAALCQKHEAKPAPIYRLQSRKKRLFSSKYDATYAVVGHGWGVLERKTREAYSQPFKVSNEPVFAFSTMGELFKFFDLIEPGKGLVGVTHAGFAITATSIVANEDAWRALEMERSAAEVGSLAIQNLCQDGVFVLADKFPRRGSEII